MGAAGLLAAAGVIALVVWGVAGESFGRKKDAPPPPVRSTTATKDIVQRIDRFCGSCHKVPPADTFPQAYWRYEIEQSYEFNERFGRPAKDLPPIEAVIRHYEENAPHELAPPHIEYSASPYPVQFEPGSIAGPPNSSPPALSNVSLVHLFDKKRLDILACEMRHGFVMVYQPYLPNPSWRILATLANPAHAEVVDLDGDGIPDILVADLGNFAPTDLRCGKVIWLRGKADGTFAPITLLERVGRVADVQAADFRGTGKLDLVVAAFGWQETGEILLLENHTTDWKTPVFEKRVIDPRHGAIHVPVADLNGDGKPDFVALISQEHETIVAYINRGDGTFETKTLYTAPHPAYGSSGIQLVDMDGDGDLDILYTNGDVLDFPYLLKPYHGIQWLENKGGLKFEHHWIAPMYGVHRAIAADFRGTGRMDILAVCFLPLERFPQRESNSLDEIIMLEQTSPGVFARHVIASKNCDHVTCAAGDLFGTGRLDFVVGNFQLNPNKVGLRDPLSIWKNLGQKQKP
jgi:hypothetical protein